MNLFGGKRREAAIVTSGRFELERDGHLATLDYTIAGNLLALIHTEIPKELRNTGIASTLAKTALDWARENHMKIDIVCPFVAGFVSTHPEYSDLVLR